MYLNQEKRLVTLNELSAKLEISKNNLIKVSNQLAKLEMISTLRGRAGGLLIKEETGKKTLKAIVTKTEETFYMTECISDNLCRCPYRPTCLLKGSILRALQAFLRSLDEETLDDVTPKKCFTKA